MKDIRVVLTDLDGTLFHDDKTISKETIKVIEQAQKKGFLVGISTARAIVNVIDYLGDFKPDFYVANGGGLVRLGDKQIYTCKFSNEETRAMLAKAYEVCGDDVEMTMDNEINLYWNREEQTRSGNSLKPVALYDDLRDFKDCAMKICVQTTDKNKAFEIAAAIGGENVDIQPFSDIPWYKFSKKEATKEKAIMALADYLKVPVSKMVSFGDDFADIGMLKLCGIGVGMENAIPEVKAIADEITASNEDDGVALWIKKNLLDED